MNFVQGENISLYADFLDMFSTPITVGLSGVTVDVFHYSSAPSRIVDISGGSMVQDATFPSVYYYNYTIPGNALVTNYSVIYNAMYSGQAVQTMETFSVIPDPVAVFVGTISVSGSVVDYSGNAINNVAVTASSGATLFGSTVTNASGLYNFLLDPGTFNVYFYNPNYFSNLATKTVPSGVTSYNFGSITLVPNSAGSLVISDTYELQDPNTLTITPLNNLKVTLWSIDTVAGGIQLGTTFTNISGTFFLNANPGNYILQVYGQDTNHSRYNFVRNIEVNAAYSPMNFEYGATSSYNFL